jgi:hypothetical protein
MALRTNPKSRETELVVQELKGELLIYDLNNNKAFCLNETSAIIWNLCDGQSTVTDITKQAGKKLKQAVTDDLVWLALDQFKKDNLLDSNQEIEIKFDELSRREVIRKVGFASLVALPVIASLVAPTAAMAQSRRSGGGSASSCGTSCASSAACTTGVCRNCSGPGTCAGGINTCGNLGGPCFPQGTCTCRNLGPGIPLICNCSVLGGVCSVNGAICTGTVESTCTGTGTCL